MIILYSTETIYKKDKKMQAKEIKKDIYWVGVKDWNLREFHGYATPHGSTYNSYLIMDEKITLVDGVKSYMSQEMTERVKSVVDFSQISYVVVNHVEMDHSGNIPEIMKLAPQAVIITDNAGKMALEAHFDTAGWNYKLVTTGESVSIGKRSLTFMTTPMLHWPDSMMTYVKEEKLLLSNDGFGQHLASDGLFVNEQPLDLVVNEAKSYYAANLLSVRETEVLTLIAQGLLNKQIADRLQIGLTTVISHRRNIMQKLGVQSVAALVICAVSMGYVDESDIRTPHK